MRIYGPSLSSPVLNDIVPRNTFEADNVAGNGRTTPGALLLLPSASSPWE